MLRQLTCTSSPRRLIKRHRLSMREPRHILVVDDEPQITRVLRTTLSTHGYDLRVANDGDAALDVMKDWAPDLVITDLSMPNMTGIELCRKIRTRSQIPIIVLSVKGEERTKIEALDSGADDYITKPFNMNELLARVRAQLRRAPAVQSGATSIEAGDFHIDLEPHLLPLLRSEVHLTPKHFEFLPYLAPPPPKLIPH